MRFAGHLRSPKLGECTIGDDTHRSESLALVQLLILYHLISAPAAVALGGEGGRSDPHDTNAGSAVPEPAT